MCVAREHLPHVGGETVSALRDRLDELAAASTETLKYFFGTDAIGLSMDGMHYRNPTRVGACSDGRCRGARRGTSSAAWSTTVNGSPAP